MSTHISLVTFDITVPESQSLKDKRNVIKSLLANLRNKFNVAVAEVGGEDTWQYAAIAVVCVANAGDFNDRAVSAVINYVESDPRYIVNNVEIEQR
jgi:uncharacterized protein YlxP (DUF503 family)